MTLPRLVLRDEVADLLDLPWERPLSTWGDTGHRFRELPVGPSRHLVRFLVFEGFVYALKELPDEVAEREYRILRHLEDARLPAVRAVGFAARPERGDAILVTEYLRHSMQYRRLLMLLRRGTSDYLDRLLDAMALLLVDLHRAGVYWGDCSLANTLFRRDGDRIQAYLVDAETGEAFPSLSDGQRDYDLEILVENVAFGLADLAAYLGRDEMDEAIEAAQSVRARYQAVWSELHDQPEMIPGDRQSIRARLRRLNDLGFSVDLEVDPVGPARLRAAPDVGHHAPLPRERARAPDAAAHARGAGADPAPRPRRVAGVARVLRAPVGRARGGRRALAARGLPADPGADRRARRARSRPRPGLLRRARAQVAAVRAGRTATWASRRRSSPTWPRARPRPSASRPRRPTRRRRRSTGSTSTTTRRPSRSSTRTRSPPD